MKGYRISTGHLPQTTSTPAEKASDLPDATCLLQVTCLVKRIRPLLWPCQSHLAGKGERHGRFAISSTAMDLY